MAVWFGAFQLLQNPVYSSESISAASNSNSACFAKNDGRAECTDSRWSQTVVQGKGKIENGVKVWNRDAENYWLRPGEIDGVPVSVVLEGAKGCKGACVYQGLDAVHMSFSGGFQALRYFPGFMQVKDKTVKVRRGETCFVAIRGAATGLNFVESGETNGIPFAKYQVFYSVVFSDKRRQGVAPGTIDLVLTGEKLSCRRVVGGTDSPNRGTSCTNRQAMDVVDVLRAAGDPVCVRGRDRLKLFLVDHGYEPVPGENDSVDVFVTLNGIGNAKGVAGFTNKKECFIDVAGGVYVRRLSIDPQPAKTNNVAEPEYVYITPSASIDDVIFMRGGRTNGMFFAEYKVRYSVTASVGENAGINCGGVMRLVLTYDPLTQAFGSH